MPGLGGRCKTSDCTTVPTEIGIQSGPSKTLSIPGMERTTSAARFSQFRRNTRACVPLPITIPRMAIHVNALHILVASSTAMSVGHCPFCPWNGRKPGWIPTTSTLPKKIMHALAVGWILSSLSLSLSLSLPLSPSVGWSSQNASEHVKTMRTVTVNGWQNHPQLWLHCWAHNITSTYPSIRTKSRKYTRA